MLQIRHKQVYQQQRTPTDLTSVGLDIAQVLPRLPPRSLSIQTYITSYGGRVVRTSVQSSS